MCHRSQLGGMEQVQRIPTVLRKRFLSTDYFTRIIPAWNGKAQRERDLFAGIN